MLNQGRVNGFRYVNGSMCAIGPSELEGYVTDRTYSDRRAPDASLSARRRAVSLSPRKRRAQEVTTELKNSNQQLCGLIPAGLTRSHDHQNGRKHAALVLPLYALHVTTGRSVVKPTYSRIKRRNWNVHPGYERCKYRGGALHFLKWDSMDEPYLDLTTVLSHRRAHLIVLMWSVQDIHWNVNFSIKNWLTAWRLSFPHTEWMTDHDCSIQYCDTVLYVEIKWKLMRKCEYKDFFCG